MKTIAIYFIFRIPTTGSLWQADLPVGQVLERVIARVGMHLINELGSSQIARYNQAMASKMKERLTKRQFLSRVLNSQLTTQHALAHLTEQLHQYEKKYNLRSEVFYQLIVGTPAEDQPDFLAWAICYRSYFRVVQSQLSAEGALPRAL